MLGVKRTGVCWCVVVEDGANEGGGGVESHLNAKGLVFHQSTTLKMYSYVNYAKLFT